MKKKITIKLSSAETSLLRELGLQIKNTPSAIYTIKLLASAAGLNRNKLVYGFKLVHGESIRQFIIRIRMEAAQQFLAANEKPIKEIASLSGYRSSANFITAFKKYYGMTALQFQRSIDL